MNARIGAIILLAAVSLFAGRATSDPREAGTAASAKSLQMHAAGARRQRLPPPFRPFVDMATFMDHVLTPAATIVWHTNGFVNDGAGDHDLSPKTDADWELVVSGAATLAEATNALRIPQRTPDADWNGYVDQLADAAERAYKAAELHDLRALSDISDHLDEVCSSCHRHYGLE
jgi:hypothetical protein